MRLLILASEEERHLERFDIKQSYRRFILSKDRGAFGSRSLPGGAEPRSSAMRGRPAAAGSPLVMLAFALRAQCRRAGRCVAPPVLAELRAGRCLAHLLPGPATLATQMH